ncbi:hypothetical protein M5K25_017767 [Dendrobium thyrsiflorum]|uniref:Uncharacterized protein n=1 Tax=Dendrobium thyrsiflorum TaxID=117978 RepID=A0ABD0UN66_DENTH
MASIFGKPLQTDQSIASISRPSVARVLVELDILKKHPDEIWLGSELNGYFQKVEFENLPIFYSHCKMHGHGIKECFRLHPHLRKEESSKQVQGRDLIPDVNVSPNPEGNEGADPIVQVFRGDPLPLISPSDEMNLKIDEDFDHDQGRNTNFTLPLLVNDQNVDEQMLAIYSTHNVVSPLLITSDEANKNFFHMDVLPSKFFCQNNGLSQTMVNVQEMDQIGVMKDIGEKELMNIANENDVTLEEGELPLEMEHTGINNGNAPLNSLYLSDTLTDMEDLVPRQDDSDINNIGFNSPNEHCKRGRKQKNFKDFILPYARSSRSIHKEGNACANWLARWGCGSDHFAEFSGSNLPPALNGFVRLDKVGVPYVKDSFYVSILVANNFPIWGNVDPVSDCIFGWDGLQNNVLKNYSQVLAGWFVFLGLGRWCYHLCFAFLIGWFHGFLSSQLIRFWLMSFGFPPSTWIRLIHYLVFYPFLQDDIIAGVRSAVVL